MQPPRIPTVEEVAQMKRTHERNVQRWAYNRVSIVERVRCFLTRKPTSDDLLFDVVSESRALYWQARRAQLFARRER